WRRLQSSSSSSGTWGYGQTNDWRGEIPLLNSDIGCPDDLAPLLGFGGDELPEISGRARKRRRTQIGEPRFYLGFGKDNIYLLVELVDDFGRRAPRGGDPEPIAGLEAR